ncbi:hypothetical protein L596_012385 [Steinernema carpocapsae]|uniref:BPTI/Kunitz inhibitor domain-containing protein n=1 Tax=Steinernema carpocapsae TaxID=34508 RepID=A0A4U5NXS3_STECR|nr:hypothetical protein L596_012385 [Steinernema carpocapsae]
MRTAFKVIPSQSLPLSVSSINHLGVQRLIDDMLFLIWALFYTVTGFPFPDYGYDCNQKVDRGIGNNFTQKFYFDSWWNNCFGFRYRGVDGNLNKFNTYKECLQACQYCE